MTDAARDMVGRETAFLAGVEEKLVGAQGTLLTGTIWRTARHDQGDRLRALMAERRLYDRQRLRELPQNRWVAMHGYRRRFLFGKRPTGVAIASVLCPMESLVAPGGTDPGPIDGRQLAAHMRDLVGEARVPHVIGVCAPTGFTEDAWRGKPDLPNVTLVLIEPKPGGGWRVGGAGVELPPGVLALFDPEVEADKLDRVREELRRRSADLLTGGMSASSVAAKLSVPEATVREAMESAAREDPELRMSRQSDGFLMYRGAAGARAEKSSMNVVERIRQLFSREGHEAEKINELAERRAKLAERRDRLYEDIGQLETKEAALLEQGRTATSQVVKRRLAAQMHQLRKDIVRQNTTANMLSKQVDIISTDIHNLTLIQQGNVAKLPTTEELTENAVQAEEILESLQSNADLVSSLETGIAGVSMSEDEMAIMKEFDAPQVAPPTAATSKAPPMRTAESRRAVADVEEPPKTDTAARKREPEREAS